MIEDEIPKVGHVIRHWYLWRHEANRGREEGVKPRPCVVVRRIDSDEGETKLFITPITTVPPKDLDQAIVVPPQTQQRLGLEGKTSWIITNELNSFTWIGPDVERASDGGYVLGALPRGLTYQLTNRLQERAQERQLSITPRDDVELQKRVQQLRQRDKDVDREL